MLKVEDRMELAVLRKHGGSIRELARVTGHSRNTVRRYLRGGEAAGARKPATKRAEKLDDFKDYIVDRMRAASPARIPAAVLFREIKERGYRGGVTRVKQFVRTLLALMGVRCLWPHNMIGRAGLVVHQASRLRSLPTSHQ